jgi:nickel-dependent lactate racemase
MYSVPYGKKSMKFNTPTDSFTKILSLNNSTPIKNVTNAVRKALLQPLDSKSLSVVAKNKNSACIVVTDITRECPDKILLPQILKIINKEISSKNITILIACGMHRKMTHEEKIVKYGKFIVDSYHVIDHDGKNKKNLVFLGKTKNGTPIWISKIAYESDLLISTGVVEPHQYGGYSGGYKTVAIGVAGDETISHTHSPKVIKNPKIRPGTIHKNPFQEDIVEIGKKVGLDFIVNVVLNDKKEILSVKAGLPKETFRALVNLARDIYEVPVHATFDVAICGVGFPKDSNLYQASRAASYLYYAPKKIIKNGGYIVIPARCQEGAGKGLGETRFFSLLKNYTIDQIRKNQSLKAGEQRALLMANVLKHCHVIVVGSNYPKIIQKAKMIPVKNMNEAFEIITKDLGNNIKTLIIPNALMTLPILR